MPTRTGSVPPRRPAANSAGTPKAYTVKAGDTLSAIARAQLGSAARWPEIAALNKDQLPDPAKLKVGMVLKLPSGAAPAATPSKVTTPAKPSTPAPGKPVANKPLTGLFGNDHFDHTIALTFDDGPNPVNTPRVLDALKRGKVKATFFVCGKNVRDNPALVRRIVAEGHTLGNHSWDHADLTKLDAARVRKELADTQKAVDEALGYHYELEQVRPPYGAANATVNEVIAQAGDRSILWNVDSQDWKYAHDDKKVLANVLDGSYSVYAHGGVVLFHDIHDRAPRLLDGLIAKLKMEGFEFVKTDELLQRKYAPGTNRPIA